MRKIALLALILVALPLLVIGYEGRKCRQETEAAMRRTGYSRKYKVVAVHFQGVKVHFHGAYGLSLLFRPEVVEIATGQPANFEYDEVLRQRPSYNCRHIMPIVSWGAADEIPGE